MAKYTIMETKTNTIIDEDVTFNNKREVDRYIEIYLEEWGLDWRVGYLFKSRMDDTPLQIVHIKTKQPVAY